MKRRNKCNFCKKFFIGLKGIVSSIFSWVVLIIPVWLINKFLLTSEKYVFAGLFSLIVLLLYIYVWGWAGNKFWKWN